MELAVSDVKEHKLDLSTTWRNLHNPTSPGKFIGSLISPTGFTHSSRIGLDEKKP